MARTRFAPLCAVAVAIVAAIAPRCPPVLVWNATASAPLGLYRVTPLDGLRRGDLVLATPPPTARNLAAKRGYLPANVPLVKPVAGLPGDTICGAGRRISINAQAVAMGLSTDSRMRPLPRWQGCRTLGPNDVFLLNAEIKDSFDGRYFGPTKRSAIIGKLRPLWTL